MSLPQNTTALDTFLTMCCAEIERRAALLEDVPGVFHDGASAFRSALDTATPITGQREQANLPVLATISALAPSPLCDAAVAAAGEIPWIPTARLDDGGENVALGMIDKARDLGDLQCGLMLVAPGASYPLHTHPPQEVYLPIAGDGTWCHGGVADFRALDDDALIYNRPNDVHGSNAGREPLCALFILWP